MEEDHRRPAGEADRQDRSRHRAQQSEGALRDGRGAGPRRRALPVERRRRERGRSSTAASGCARGRSTSTTSTSTRRTRTTSSSTSSGSTSRPTAARRSRRSSTPHGDNHGMWINPDNPDIMLQVNDGGANVTLNGGRSWSSILNQPHAEYYMVAVDEQYPYRLYVPQQDNTTLIIPSLPPVSWGLDHPARDLAAGVGLRDRSDLAAQGRLRRVGRVQGRGRPLQRADRPGEALLGLSAEPLRPRSRTRSSTASRGRRSSISRRTTTRSSIRRRTCCIARPTKA